MKKKMMMMVMMRKEKGKKDNSQGRKLSSWRIRLGYVKVSIRHSNQSLSFQDCGSAPNPYVGT